MPKIIPYNPNLKPLARKLRKTMTPGELLLWNEFSFDKFLGLDFDRQRCIDNYIVDFYCKDLLLAIEIDGMSHNNENAHLKDEIRQNKLESFGITVVRFSEAEIKHDMFNVLRTMELTCINIIKNNPDVFLPKNCPLDILKR